MCHSAEKPYLPTLLTLPALCSCDLDFYCHTIFYMREQPYQPNLLVRICPSQVGTSFLPSPEEDR